MHAVQIDRLGGPDVLDYVEVPDPVPGASEVLIRQEAIGLNFIDIYRRTGVYPIKLPAILGSEGAGVVEAVGAEVKDLQPGERVAYAGGLGSYAEKIVMPADQVVRLPGTISAKIAAASMLKGMTAEFLTRIWPLQAGDAVLVHAAAGGVGSILCQWLNAKGAYVIGSVGSEAKAEFARSHGCREVLLYRQEDVAARTRELTGGRGVKVVYDSVGKATFEASLKSLARRGLFVSFGNASGPVEPLAPLRLAQAGSVFLTRPTLFDYIATRQELESSAAALLEAIASGAVSIDIGREFALKEAGEAHRALEARETTAASILIP